MLKYSDSLGNQIQLFKIQLCRLSLIFNTWAKQEMYSIGDNMNQSINQIEPRLQATVDRLRANSKPILRAYTFPVLGLLLTSSLLFLPSVAISDCTWSSLIGDANGDEDITPGDALEVFWSSINGDWQAMDNYCCLDANKDSVVTPGDALMLFWYSIYGGSVEGVTGNVGEPCISDCEIVTDIDGNEYRTVMIGSNWRYISV